MNALTFGFSLLFSLLSLVAGGLPWLKLKAPYGFILLPLKLSAAGLAPLGIAAGGLGLALGWLAHSWPAVVLGGLSAGLCALFIYQVLALPDPFEPAFGKDWQSKIPPERAARLLPRRWVGWLSTRTNPGWQRDIPFWTFPGSERQLLCDLWTPPAGIPLSGMAFIYSHGSDWYLLDKDFGTRLFFRHLAGQGHVVMDVAYRLSPETDMSGMVGDVKRAVAWMKDHGKEYGVDPQKIILGGGSAGGHLSLLAAYAPYQAEMTPPDVKDYDLSVRGVISEYGPTDLKACYFHTNQDKTTRSLSPAPATASKPAPARQSSTRKSDMARLGFDKPSDSGAFVKLLGGHPEQAPEAYARYSPLTYIHPGCPPTLLIQGTDDLITPAFATRCFHKKLEETGVLALNVIYPHTDHAFDLFFPRLSPAAQSSYFMVDHFLALLG